MFAILILITLIYILSLFFTLKNPQKEYKNYKDRAEPYINRKSYRKINYKTNDYESPFEQYRETRSHSVEQSSDDDDGDDD